MSAMMLQDVRNSADVRELTTTEVDEVTGAWAIELVVLATVVFVAACNRAYEEGRRDGYEANREA